jgi:hypothetical protein
MWSPVKNLSPLEAVEVYRVLRFGGSHIVRAVGSHVGEVSALRTGRSLFPRSIIFLFLYSFLVEAERTPQPRAAGRIR